MKKVFTLALVAIMAISAYAAQINWGDNFTATFRLEDPNGSPISQAMMGSYNSYDVYFINETWLTSMAMGAGDLLADLPNIGDYASDSKSGLDALYSIDAPALYGVMNPGSIWKFTYEAGSSSSRDMATLGDQFFILVVADFDDGNGLVYQLIENTTWKSTAGDPPNDAQSFTWGATTSTPWQPVPEPMTVGLALAGVALLIAQRKRK